MDQPASDSQALPAGTRLEEFTIERVLGAGGFGITYLARDTRLDRQVVIKENLPVQFCFRDTHSLTVAPRRSHGDDAENFRWSLENFSREAALLASVDHQGIVKVLRSFEAFGTAYFVMPFVEGMALDALIETRRAKGQQFSEDELRGMLERTLDALKHLHDRGIYHRDIKPGNILITDDGIPVLIDFGSARQRLSERSMTVVESAGYTPFEQLQSRGNVGPWSDLYALGGTLCKVLTGEAPPKAMDRMRRDPFLPLASRSELGGRYSVEFLRGIDKALAVEESDRWQDAKAWRAARGEPCEARSRTDESVPSVPATSARPSPPNHTGKVKMGPWILVICALLGIFVYSVVVSNQAITSERWEQQQETEARKRVSFRRPVIGDRPGEEREFEIAPGVLMRMCWIPPGDFMMGSPAYELGRRDDEIQHHVTLTQGFWLGKYEVTQAQWQAVMGGDPSHSKGGDLPVESVSWDEISGSGGFIEKANRGVTTGDRFHLPTEAQWEYACRAGTTTALNNGLNLTSTDGACPNLEEVAWFDQNSGGHPQPVGSKAANAWGLHDMHGNVWEWCSDWYRPYPRSAVTDFRGPDSGSFRVHRGGGWAYDCPNYCRVAYRGYYNPTDSYNTIGFRLARSSIP